MEVRITRNKEEIYSFLSESPECQLYLIGDLDDFFWPNTTWFALYDKEVIISAGLLYSGMNPSTFLLFYEGDPSPAAFLLKSVMPQLPEKFNVHLGPGLIDQFGRENILTDYGRNWRMILKRSPVIVHDKNIRILTGDDLQAINQLYSVSYPDNWFDKRMVETGKYFGYFVNGELTGIAGIHVWSEEYRIAALGNIATHPAHRGKQIAFKLTSALCANLVRSADVIGLNVKSDNIAAISSYIKAGFEKTGEYDECLVKNPTLNI